MNQIITKDEIMIFWKRYKNDFINNRVFFNNPFEFLLIENDLNTWIDSISSELENNSYTPDNMSIIDIPKPNYGIRNGVTLKMRDGFVYTWNVSKILKEINKYISKKYDYAYQLKDITNSDWMKNRFKCWEEFRLDSIKKMSEEKYCSASMKTGKK